MAVKKKSSYSQKSFSRRFSAALTITYITDAIVKSDGWDLEQLTLAPRWLRDMYDRHADAAYQAIQEIENNLKPSEHN